MVNGKDGVGIMVPYNRIIVLVTVHHRLDLYQNRHSKHYHQDMSFNSPF